MDPKKNYFRLYVLAFVSWRFMLIFMASTQLKFVGVVELMAYRNIDLLVSCTSWDPATLFIVSSSTRNLRSWMVEISILPLLDLRASRKFLARNMDMLAQLFMACIS